MADNIRVKLEGVPVSFPHVFRKHSSIEDGTPKFSLNAIIDEETKAGRKARAAMDAAIEKAKKSLWGDNPPRIKDDRICLKDGNDMLDGSGEVRDGYQDVMYVKASTQKRPNVRDRDGKTPLTEEDDKVIGGDICNVWLDVWPTKDKKLGGNGVFATLVGVQFVKEGNRFGGGKGLSDDDFDDLGDDDSDDDEDAEDDRSSRKSSNGKSSKSSKRSRDEEDDEDDRRSRRSAKSSRRSRDEDDEDEDDDII